MSGYDVETNPLFTRGKVWLDTKIDGPDDLIAFWSIYGRWLWGPNT